MSMSIPEQARHLADALAEELRGKGTAHGEVHPVVYHAAKPLLEERLGCPVVSKTLLCDFMADAYGTHWRAEHAAKKETAALRTGSLIDCLALTPHLFDELYVAEDINRRTNAGKARAAELEAAGLTPLTHAEYEAASEVARAVRGSICARHGESWGSQYGLFALVESVGGEPLPCRVVITGMVDILPRGEGSPLADLKTTSRPLTDAAELNRNIARYGYGVQAAMYCDLWAAAHGGETRGFEFLFVSTDEPTRLRWVRVRETDLALYRARYTAALAAYCRAWTARDWGRAELPEMVYDPPAWDAARGASYGDTATEEGGEP